MALTATLEPKKTKPETRRHWTVEDCYVIQNTFNQVDKSKGFAKAAEILGVSESAVIAKFYSLKNKGAITEAGQIVKSAIAKVVASTSFNFGAQKAPKETKTAGAPKKRGRKKGSTNKASKKKTTSKTAEKAFGKKKSKYSQEIRLKITRIYIDSKSNELVLTVE
jgi:hypothetical protein